MDQNQKNEKPNNTSNSQKSAQNAGFFRMTKLQIEQNISKYESIIHEDNTVFQSKLSENQSTPVIFKKRLNSLDTAMLENAAYNVLDDNSLKLEKRIETVKNNIAEIEEKIEVATTIKDSAAVNELSLQKQIATENLKKLSTEYKMQNCEPRLSKTFSKIFNAPKQFRTLLWKKFIHALRTSVFFKHIKPLMRSFLVRDTITKLNKINKSVDELVKMQIPFGEQDARYATLVSQLAGAGALHSQILKEFQN